MERPTAVTICGILNIIFGGLGVLSLATSGAVVLGMDPANPVSAVMQRAPIYKIWTIVSLFFGLIMSFALIAAGMGLFQGKPWARKLSLFYAVYALVIGGIAVLMNVVFLVLPLLAGANSSDPAAVGALGGAIGGTVGSCFGFIYPVALLVFMRKPVVLAWFGEKVPDSQTS